MMIIYYVTNLTKSHSLSLYLSNFSLLFSQQCFDDHQSSHHSCLLSEKRNDHKVFLIRILESFDALDSFTFRHDVF